MTTKKAITYLKQAHKNAMSTANSSDCTFTKNYYSGQVGGLCACLKLLDGTKEGKRVFKTLTGVDVE